jgi:hypothetical protein
MMAPPDPLADEADELPCGEELVLPPHPTQQIKVPVAAQSARTTQKPATPMAQFSSLYLEMV